MKETCGTCKYFLKHHGEFRCDNEYSEHYYEVKDYDDTCYEYEGNDE